MRLRICRTGARRTRTELALLLLCAALPGCQSQPASGFPDVHADTGAVPTVPVAAVVLHNWPRAIRVQGTLAADEQAVIGAKVAGRVEKVRADRGTEVAEDQVLVELEMADFDLRVQQAEAALESVRSKLGLRNGEPDTKLNPLRAPPVLQEQAMKEEAQLLLDRAKQLVRQSAATAEQVQQQEAVLKVAKARYDSAINNVFEQIALIGLRKTELALAQQQRTDARITAPFAGIVQERRVSPGAFLAVGQPVVTLVRINPLRFQAAVPERDVRLVKPGEPIAIWLEGQKEPIPARIDRISPSLEKQSLSLVLEADVPNPGNKLRAGHFAQGDIIVDRDAQVLAVPQAAVFEFAGVEKVWLVEGGMAREQRVQTGRRDRGLVEILGGLKAGDMVITSAAQGRIGPVIVSTTAP
jgi:RND family efflux transporter MFP subunit